MCSPYHSIPIQCASNLFQPFVDFIYLHSYQYSDVLIIYSLCWWHYYYRFGLQYLWTSSHIQSLRHHFDLSEVIFTYILPPLPFYTENIIPGFLDFVRLCIASIWLRLHSPEFLDLIPHTSTFDIPCSTLFFWLFFILAHILSVSLQSCLIFCYLHWTTYMDIPLITHTIYDYYWAGYYPFTTPCTHWSHRNRLYQNFALLDHSVSSII
jgi:hypothetical protein